jgi:hypothetical protein
VAAKKKKYNDSELQAMTGQFTFDETFEDYMKAKLEDSIVGARLDRDKNLMIYWVSKQTSTVGAVQKDDQFALSYGNYNIVAKPSADKTTVDHEKVYEEVKTLLTYYDTMITTCESNVLNAISEEEKTRQKIEKRVWEGKKDAIAAVLQIKVNNTNVSSSQELSLKVSKTKTKKKAK